MTGALEQPLCFAQSGGDAGERQPAVDVVALGVDHEHDAVGETTGCGLRAREFEQRGRRGGGGAGQDGAGEGGQKGSFHGGGKEDAGGGNRGVRSDYRAAGVAANAVFFGWYAFR